MPPCRVSRREVSSFLDPVPLPTANSEIFLELFTDLPFRPLDFLPSHYSNSDAQGRIPLRFCQVVLSLAITPIPNVPVVSRSHSIARRRLRDEHVGITDVRTRQSAAEKHFVPCSFRAISAGNAALKSPRAHQIQATHAKHTHVSSQAVVDVVGIVCPKKIQPTERAGGDKSSKHDPAPTSVRSPASQLETCNMTPPFAKQQ